MMRTANPALNAKTFSQLGYPVDTNNAMTLQGTVNKTGPVHLTKSFYLKAGQGTIDIALPPNYFYPICNPPYFFRTPVATKEERERWVEEGAFTIHHWSMSWMPPEFRQAEFKTIDNYESCKTWNQ